MGETRVLCTWEPRWRETLRSLGAGLRAPVSSDVGSPSLSASTVQYCVILHCTVQYWAILHCTVQYSTGQYCTVLYSTVLCNTALYCTVQYYAAQYTASCLVFISGDDVIPNL